MEEPLALSLSGLLQVCSVNVNQHDGEVVLTSGFHTGCRTGQISEEEKARRLAEMSGNADAHEEARWARLQAARKRDDSEAEAEAVALEKKAALGELISASWHQA